MIKIVEKIINNYQDELTDEEAFYLWDRWNRMVRYNCVPEWEEDVWSFVEFAVSRGFELGEKVKRKDSSAPYSPDNCVFESGERGALPPKKKQPKIETSEVKALADRWNKCVYAPNRERVEKYRKTATQELPDPGSKRHCSWCYDEFCVYDRCPARGDWCPTENYPGLCRFDSRSLSYK